MGILKNEFEPFTALNNVRRLDKEKVIEIVKRAGIREYGVSNNNFVFNKWIFEESSENKPDKIIGALNNNDTKHMLLDILKENTQGVVEGLAIAALVAGTENVEIVIPEEDVALVDRLLFIGKGCGIKVTVTNGIVDIRGAGNSIIHHFETAAAISELFGNVNEYKKTTVVAVKKAGETLGKPMEISYGMTVGEIISSVENENIKAISIGTSVYDASAVDLIIDEKFSLENGIITVFNEKCCMVDQAEKELLEVIKNGCGKCTFCREGTIQIYTRIKDITQGKGQMTDIDMIKEIGSAMGFSSMCSMGQTAANFVLTSLKFFGEEIEAHIRKKRCLSGVCNAFMNIYINPLICDGCGDCIDVCPIDCIEGKAKYIHMIDEFDCTKCGKCSEVCPNNAIVKTKGHIPKLPERLTRVGRFNKR